MNEHDMKVGCESAYMQALKGFREGGVPVGCALLVDGAIVSLGHNRRFQQGSNILHGEMDCIEKAGHGVDFRRSTLFTTLSPCVMCSSTILLFGIPRLVVLDDTNTGDFETGLDGLRDRGVEVVVLEHEGAIGLNDRFQNDPETRKLWLGDVGR